MGTKRAFSWQGTEATFNTAGSPWTLKVLSGKWSSYCNLGVLVIIRSFPCCVLDFKEKLVDGLMCENRKRKSFLLRWVKNKWSFMFPVLSINLQSKSTVKFSQPECELFRKGVIDGFIRVKSFNLVLLRIPHLILSVV